MKKSIDFMGDDPDYTVSTLQNRINKDPSIERAVRSEYTRLRDIAQKRVKRMGKSEFSKSETFQQYGQGFKKLKDLDKSQLATALHELQKFVSSKKSTLKGQREAQRKTIETLRESGLDVNKKNYWAFWSIMHEMRSRKVLYGSDKALELADALLERDMMSNNSADRNALKAMEDSTFTKLLENSSQLDTIPEGINTTEEMSDYIKELGW